MAKRSNRSPNVHGPSGPVIAGHAQDRRATARSRDDSSLLFDRSGMVEAEASEAADIGGTRGSDQPAQPPNPHGDGI